MPGGDDRVVPPARLKARPDFVRASGGGRVHSRSFSLQVSRRPAEGDPVPGCRVGLTVTKKVGGAVERNRIKRRLREALRTPGLPTLPDHDYVVVARRDALSAPFAGLVGELRRCLGDAGSGKAKSGKTKSGKTKAGRPRGAGPPRGSGPRRGSDPRGGAEAATPAPQ